MEKLNVPHFTLATLIMACADECNANGLGNVSADTSNVCNVVCERAGYTELGFPVYLLLAYTWNDAIDWAQRQLR